MGIVFAPDGRRAYVSGLEAEDEGQKANASPEERVRATGALRSFRAGRDVREFLTETADEDG